MQGGPQLWSVKVWTNHVQHRFIWLCLSLEGSHIIRCQFTMVYTDWKVSQHSCRGLFRTIFKSQHREVNRSSVCLQTFAVGLFSQGLLTEGALKVSVHSFNWVQSRGPCFSLGRFNSGFFALWTACYLYKLCTSAYLKSHLNNGIKTPQS